MCVYTMSYVCIYLYITLRGRPKQCFCLVVVVFFVLFLLVWVVLVVVLVLLGVVLVIIGVAASRYCY